MREVVILAFLAALVRPNDCRAHGHCSEDEFNTIEKEHVKCTQQVEERYAATVETFQVAIPPPIASAYPNRTKSMIKKPQDNTELCNMLHDVVEKCGLLFKKCLDEKDYRRYLDAQLEIFTQMMTTLYNLGDEIHQCEAVQEYQRSGRGEEVQATDLCPTEKVTQMTIKYQQCMEDANLDMTRKMIGHQTNFDLAFNALCDGILQVVHGCSGLLHECYTVEEIEETKIGQLELMRKVFLDIIEDTSSDDLSNWNFDITKCPAFNSATKVYSPITTGFTLSLIILTLNSYFQI